jgi:Protein of unknown function (DUF3138)
MKKIRLTALSAALLAAFAAPSAMAQSNEELLKELKALRARVEELEKKVATPPAAAAPTEPKWGMTPEQVQEFNRIAVKTEALEDSLESQGYKGLKVSGYIEPAFVYNQRQERAGFQFLNQQSDGYFYDTSYIGSASIDFTKEVEGGTIWKLTLTPNRGVGAAIDGASIVQEATVAIPLGSLQTRLVAGQIPDWSGYEYQQPTLNPFTSHNLLYDFTLPVGYTGVGISHTQGKWWLRGAIANVNSTIRGPGEKAPALVYRVDYSKGEFDGWGLAGLHGKTANFNFENKRTMTHLFEVDGYYLRGDWALQGQVSVGTQKEGAITPDADGNFRDSRWWGVSGLAGYMFTPRFQGLVRADYINNKANGGGLFGYNGYYDPDNGGFNDPRNGIGPEPGADLNRGANRYALTVGMKYAYDLSTTFKLEYRLDGADRAVFEDLSDGSFKKNNSMLAASVVVAF